MRESDLEGGSRKIKILIAVFVLLFSGNFFVWREVFRLDDRLNVVFFDVGQGDSIFIETPQKHQILIDGGPNQKIILEKLGKQMPFWDKTIDLVVLTHPDYDHLNGLLAVLENYKVENVLWLGSIKENTSNRKWLELLTEEKSKNFMAETGMVIKAGQANIFVLYPFVPVLAEDLEKKSNENSVVLKMIFGESEFLFTGDISRKEEERLLLASFLPTGLESDVLKISHHGSKTATSEMFLDIVRPQIAIISCGRDNSYGHPHKETLRILENFAINIKRTDLQGDIKIASDGFNLFF